MRRSARHRPRQLKPLLPAHFLYVPLTFMFVLIAIASFLPERRLWGINHLAFYPLPARLGLLGFIGVSFVPGIARGFHSFVVRAIDRLGSRPRLLVRISIITAIIAMVVFIGFRSSTLLLGDGRLVADNFKHAFMRDTTPATSSQMQILKHEPIARGSTLLYYWFSYAVDRLFNWPPLKALRIFNCLLGGILIFVLMRLIQKSRFPTELRAWLFLLVLSSGAIELFFGYVENYTPLAVLAVLYVVSGFALIERKSASWLCAALICLVLSTFMHLQGILLAPSFALLLIWFWTRTREKSILRAVSPVLTGLVLVGTYVAGAFTGYGEYLLSIGASGDSPGILTPSHWIDVLNEILLLLPMFPVFVVLAIGVVRSTRHAEESGSRLSGDAEWHFASSILVPCFLFLVVFNPRLGMARDWDLFALTSVGLIPLAVLVLKRLLPHIRTKDIPRVVSPAFVMSAVLAVAWIGINSSGEMSARRYKSILSYDETFGQYAYETLAKHYYDEGRIEEAITMMETAVSFSYNSRLCILLSVYYRDSGRPVDAARVLRPVLEHESRNEKVRSELALLLSRAGQYEELFEVARKGTEYHPENPVFHSLYGKMLIALDRVEEGVEELLKIKQLDSPRELVDEADRIIKKLEDEGRL